MERRMGWAGGVGEVEAVMGACVKLFTDVS
jgi:hypothetical protein